VKKPLEPSQVGILVHEFAHLTSKGLIDDLIYDEPSLLLPPLVAFANADNYRLAVQGANSGVNTVMLILEGLGVPGL
jgi:hypothetical protein